MRRVRIPIALLMCALCLSLSTPATALDLSLDPQYHITPPVEDVKAGDVVDVFVTARVVEGILTSNVTTVLMVDGEVRFYQNITDTLSENETIPLWYAVVLPAGNFTLTVMVDPFSEIPELTKANNNISFPLYVRAWNGTEGEAEVTDQGKEESPFEYLPYVMVALIVVVVGLTGLAIYLLEKRRIRREKEEEELLRYRR